jgi:ADP-heptose:LPS heptosyltransferase
MLAEHGQRTLCISGPREAEVGRALEHELAGVEDVHHWVGQRGLRELAALYTAAAAARAPFVGPDSGPMHLAAACGMRVVALVGPQSYLRTGPWPIPGADDAAPWLHTVIGSPTAPDCAPCLARRCTHPGGPVCMRGLPPELVAAKLAGA